MAMLFMAFLNVRVQRDLLQGTHFRVLGFNLLLPLLFFGAALPFDPNLAFAAFAIGISPTAAGAPVIAVFLKSKVEYVTASVLLTSPIVAIALPFMLPEVINWGSRPASLIAQQQISILEILLPVMTLVFIPLILSQLVRRLLPKVAGYLKRWSGYTFYLFLINVYLASAKATHFIRNESGASWQQLLLMALIIGLICVVQFQLGERLNKGKCPTASGLALGRKNTMFGLWVALTYLTPVAALGPIFYIVFQNAYNSVQMFKIRQGKYKGALHCA